MDIVDIRPDAALEAAKAIRHAAVPLPDPRQVVEFGAFFDGFADAKLVLLGEASHGTAEFYRARAAITRNLIEHHGFNIVAAEADWPDARQVDRFVRHLPTGGAPPPFARFPTWMWHNVEFAEFVDWLRGFNDGQRPDKRVELRGLDIYSLRA